MKTITRKVEGFDPTTLAIQMVDVKAGTQKMYLPVKGQIAWFWLFFPNGKIDCIPPQIIEDRVAIATCLIYADKNDAPQDFICRQTATYRYVSGKEDTYSFVERAQTNAMGRALRFAGFGSEFDYAGDSPPSNFVAAGKELTDDYFDLSEAGEAKTEEEQKDEPVVLPVPEPEKAAPSKFSAKPGNKITTKVVTIEESDQIPLEDPAVKLDPIAEEPVKPEVVAPDTEKVEAAKPIEVKPVVPVVVKATVSGALPTTVEEALNLVISLPRFNGQTFRQILEDPKNKNLPDWVCKNSGFSGVSDATRVAAQILCQE